MSFQTISAILKGKWLIDPAWAEVHFPLINGLVEGKIKLDAMKPAKGEMAYPFMVLPNGKHINLFEERMGEWGMSVDTSKTNSKAQPGTVAVIPIIGPIMKYDGSCGEAGSITRGEWFKMADADENVTAIIGYIDSPGGQVDGTASLADLIKGLTKPTIAIIDDGMMASAAMWIGSAFSEIYASQPTDSAGSIGVYTTLLDISGYYEKQGVKMHTVYAPESSEKNLDYREAMKGKYSMLEADLSFIAQTFRQVIINNRGEKLTSDKWNKGALYFADEAAEIGLIDGIKSFDDVVKLAREKANGKQAVDTRLQNETNNTDMKFPKLEAFVKLPTAEVTEEMVNAANTEMAEAEIEGVRIVLESEQVALVEKAEQVDALTGQITDKDQQIANLTAERDSLHAQLKKPAEDPASPEAKGDKIPASGGEPAYNVTSVDQEKARQLKEWGN